MPGSRVFVADATKRCRGMEPHSDLVLELSREPLEIDQICQLQKCSPHWEEQSIKRVFHSSLPESRVIVADATKRCRGMETRWDIVLELSREPLEIDLICQLQICSPNWEEQSINRMFHSSMPGSRVIVEDATKRCRWMETRCDLVLELFREPLEIHQICQLQRLSPQWAEQSINRVFHFSMPGSRVIVAEATKRCRGIETRSDLVLELSREPLEIDQICQLQKCSPHWEEQSIYRVFHSSLPESRVIVADATKRFRGMETRLDLVLELSREPLEIDLICQLQICSPHWEEQSINRMFHSSMPGSRIIVADATKRCRWMETRCDLVLELFRELLEIDQICQLQRLSPHWEEQSIYRVFHSSLPESRVIVADATKRFRGMETRLDLVLELSREPLEIDLICQLQICSPHWEEQSINRMFHSSMPGSRIIVADATKRCRWMETRCDLVLELFRELLEIDQICQLQRLSPQWEEQSSNRVFHFSMPGSRVIVADATKRCRGMETRSDLVLELSREPLEIDQICQLQKCSPHWEEQSIYRVFHSSLPESRVIVADATKRCRGMETCCDLVLELFREPLEIDQICQLQRLSPQWEEQSINRVFHFSMPGSRVFVADATKRCRGMEPRSDLVLELSREPLEIDQICQLQKCSPHWEEQSIKRVFHSSLPESRVIVADATKRCRGMETRWDIVLELSREPLEIDLICQLQICSPNWEEQSINRMFHSSMPGSRVIVEDATKRCRWMETRCDLVLELFREPLEIHQICQLQRLSPQWAEQSINRVFHFSMPGSRVIVAEATKRCRGIETRSETCTWIIWRTIRDRPNMSIAKMFASLRGTIYL